jgi:hypothetical protein
MATGYIVLAVMAALVAAGILWDSWKSRRLFRRPMPAPYRDRASQKVAWQQRCGERLAEADALLTVLCDAFSFNSDDRYRFGPDDRITDIYRACYPRWKFWQIGDSMEMESLMLDLERQFGIETEAWRPDITLGDVVELVTLHY